MKAVKKKKKKYVTANHNAPVCRIVPSHAFHVMIEGQNFVTE